jgi:uncharacterized Tic20 family protein
MSESTQRMLAILVHVLSIFFWLLVPLVGFIVLRNKGFFLRSHVATELNFQLTMLLTAAVGLAASVIIVGYIMLLAVPILMLIFPIIAAVKAGGNQIYRYPIAIRFVH